jgi:hypothetical protein
MPRGCETTQSTPKDGALQHGIGREETEPKWPLTAATGIGETRTELEPSFERGGKGTQLASMKPHAKLGIKPSEKLYLVTVGSALAHHAVKLVLDFSQLTILQVAETNTVSRLAKAMPSIGGYDKMAGLQDIKFSATTVIADAQRAMVSVLT